MAEGQSEVVPCLLRIGENLKKYKVFKLTDDKVKVYLLFHCYKYQYIPDTLNLYLIYYNN